MLEGGFCYAKERVKTLSLMSLNPYYAGRWFLLGYEANSIEANSYSLNPYYAGRWFLLKLIEFISIMFMSVLILIMLEGGFCFIRRLLFGK